MAPEDWELHADTLCAPGFGADDLPDGYTAGISSRHFEESIALCKAACSNVSSCSGFVIETPNALRAYAAAADDDDDDDGGSSSRPAHVGHHCFLKTNIYIWRCDVDYDWDLWTRPGCGEHCHLELASGYQPPPPDNKELNSTDGVPPIVKFFALGDWNFDHDGWDWNGNGLPDWVGNSWVCKRTCQSEIADFMREEARLHPGLYKFVVNAGDNFYPFGVDGPDNPDWESRWGSAYLGLPSMPWYSVMGNHDIAQTNRKCACGRNPLGCSQVRKHGAGITKDTTHTDGNHTWVMPDFNYFVRPLPGVALEIVSLDSNYLDSARICPWNACDRAWCEDWEKNSWDDDACTVPECRQILRERAEAAIAFLYERLQVNKGGHVIINTHYPSDYFERYKFGANVSGVGWVDAIALFGTEDPKITYIGAHRHATNDNPDHPWLISPSAEWTVGGAGGWSCDGPQGIVVGDVVTATGEVTNMRVIRADWNTCCRRNPHPRPDEGPT